MISLRNNFSLPLRYNNAPRNRKRNKERKDPIWFGVYRMRVYQPGNRICNSSLKRNIYWYWFNYNPVDARVRIPRLHLVPSAANMAKAWSLNYNDVCPYGALNNKKSLNWFQLHTSSEEEKILYLRKFSHQETTTKVPSCLKIPLIPFYRKLRERRPQVPDHANFSLPSPPPGLFS